MFIKNTHKFKLTLHYTESGSPKLKNLPIDSNYTIQADFITAITQIENGERLYNKGWIRTGTTLSATTVLTV